MKHAREDYQRRFGVDPAIDDPSLLNPGGTPIAEDEPVMLFRAQDVHFLRLLDAYTDLLEDDPAASDDIIDAVYNHLELARDWQRTHKTKTPDL